MAKRKSDKITVELSKADLACLYYLLVCFRTAMNLVKPEAAQRLQWIMHDADKDEPPKTVKQLTPDEQILKDYERQFRKMD